MLIKGGSYVFLRQGTASPRLDTEHEWLSVFQLQVAHFGRAHGQRRAELAGIDRVIREHIIVAGDGAFGLNLRGQLGSDVKAGLSKLADLVKQVL